MEGTTAVFLLTVEDDFNALAAEILRGDVEEAVHRISAPREGHGVVAPYIGGEVLFGLELTSRAFSRRYAEGAAVLTRPADGETLPPGHDLLFLVRRDGRLDPVTEGGTPPPAPGDTLVVLVPVGRGATTSPQ